MKSFFAFLFILVHLPTSLLASSATSHWVRISENAEKGSFVANASSLLQLKAPTGSWKVLDEKLSSSPSSSQLTETQLRRKWFKLNETSGMVTLRKQVDREALCGKATTCDYVLEIYAVSIQKLLNLHVIIDDVNDNPPVFPFRRIVVNVSEAAALRDVISLNQFLAQDADSGENSLITYSISPNPFFTIEQSRDNAETIQVNLVVTEKLDHESASVHELTLMAEDHGSPPLSGSSELVVKVLDVNDNDPVFEKQEYFVDLSENLFPGYVVIRVQADDDDAGNAGTIRYHLSAQNDPVVRRLLKVDDVTGDVILRETLDRESHDKMRVRIEARDLGSTNRRTGSTWVFITVKDVNDNLPVININFIYTADGNTVYLPENVKIGTNFAYVTAKDADSGRNGQVRIFIESIRSDRKMKGMRSSLGAVFNLTDLGFLSTSRTLDREALDRYDVTMKACDNGYPKKCSSRTFIVMLLDVNDHRPILSSSLILLTLSEDAPIGTVLTTIKATDEDTHNPPALYENENHEILDSPYGKIFYHIIDGDGTFRIDSRSGQLTLARRLDREERERYQITVRAKDSGREMALQSTCKVQIEVTDVNDNRPRFTTPRGSNATYYATIRRKHAIAYVQAVDYDKGENGTVSYGITMEDGIGKTKRDPLFLLDEHSGELTLNLWNKKLNESLGQHRVIIQARDNGSIPLYSTRVVDVIVVDTETLPTVEVSNLAVSSPPTMMFIVMSVVAFIMIMLIIIAAVTVRWQRKRRKSRTYICPTDTPRDGEWSYDALLKTRSISDSRVMVANAVSLRSGSDVDSNRASEKRYDSAIIEAPDQSWSNEVEKCDRRTSGGPVVARLSLLENSESGLSKKLPALLLPKPTTSSSHDGDSGRGDSDPDAPVSDVTNDGGNRGHFSSGHAKPKCSSRTRNPRCNEQCFLYGHSDQCWMPYHDQGQNTSSSFSTPQRATTTPTWPDVKPTSGQSGHPVSYNYREGRVLQATPGSIPHRHAWNYPANDLSAIYSDVIMTPPLPNGRRTPSHVPCSYPGYSVDDTPPPLDRRSSGVCVSSGGGSQFYQTISGSRIRTSRQTPDPGHAKRYSASIISPSTSSTSQIARCSSADFLDSPRSGEKDVKDTFRRKSSLGAVSMQETQEIIDNIDKLLTS